MRYIYLLLLFIFILGCSSTEVQIIGQATNTEIIENNNIEPEIYFCPRDNCSQHMIEHINNAKSTIHCALFDLDLEPLINTFKTNALTKDVKLVVDKNNEKGIENIPFIRFDNNNQLTHNKFCIFDNNIIWTGSFNPTTRGDTKNNNNVVVYNSIYLANNFEQEFQELWQGTFGKGKKTTFPIINLNNKLIENYFCPEDQCAKQVIRNLKTANKSIKFLTFSFTHDLIGNELIRKYNKGLEVRGIFEKTQKNKYTEYTPFTNYGMNISWDKNKANMHHKFFIIDDKIVITGSFNPSASGDTRNDENLLIIHDKDVAKKYLEEFELVWNI